MPASRSQTRYGAAFSGQRNDHDRARSTRFTSVSTHDHDRAPISPALPPQFTGGDVPNAAVAAGQDTKPAGAAVERAPSPGQGAAPAW